MPLHRDQVIALLTNLKAEMLEGWDAHTTFMQRLKDDDDWAFVIKAQALIEAAVTQAVVSHVGSEKLQRLVERLPLADEEVGKLAVARDMELLSKSQRRFVRRMASLRNQLAHRVEYVDFSFQKYIESLDTTALRDWRDSIVWFELEQENREYWYEAAVSSPRTVLFLATQLLVLLLHVGAVEARTARRIDAAALKTSEELYEKAFRVDADG